MSYKTIGKGCPHPPPVANPQQQKKIVCCLLNQGSYIGNWINFIIWLHLKDVNPNSALKVVPDKASLASSLFDLVAASDPVV